MQREDEQHQTWNPCCFHLMRAQQVRRLVFDASLHVLLLLLMEPRAQRLEHSLVVQQGCRGTRQTQEPMFATTTMKQIAVPAAEEAAAVAAVVVVAVLLLLSWQVPGMLLRRKRSLTGAICWPTMVDLATSCHLMVKLERRHAKQRQPRQQWRGWHFQRLQIVALVMAMAKAKKRSCCCCC